MCSNYGIEISFAHPIVLRAIPFWFIYTLSITENTDYHMPNPIILTIDECPFSELNCNQKKVSKSPPLVTRGQPPHRPVQHCCRSYTSESNNHAPALTVSSSLSVCLSVRPTVGEVKILCPDVIVISDWHLFVSSSSSLNQLVDLPHFLLLPIHSTFSSSSSREHVLIIVVSDCCFVIVHLSLITWIMFLAIPLPQLVVHIPFIICYLPSSHDVFSIYIW